MGYIFQNHNICIRAGSSIFFEDTKEVLNEYKSYRLSLFKKYGNSEDTGQLSTLPANLQFQDETFASIEEAVDYIQQKHQKHSPAIAVKVLQEELEHYVIGGWCNH
jgi:hypothetical protein